MHGDTHTPAAGVPSVLFGDEWGIHATSTQHLARRLAMRNPLLYVNAVGLRSPRLNLRDLQRAWNKIMQWAVPAASSFLEAPPQFHLYSPVRIPWNSVAWFRWWNRRMLLRGVQNELHRHGMNSPVMLVSSPVGGEAVGSLGERLLVYYVTDDYAALPGVDRRYVEEMEQILLAHADLIFVTSAELQRSKIGKKGPTLLLPHGVDFEHFHASVDPLGAIPDEMKNLPRPLLGFYGLLAPWVDGDLLVTVARAFPHGSVVLIGPGWSGYQPPQNVPNLHWLGPRSYEDLPRYAAHFDVGLIAFKQDRLTASVNPLKLLEYLALGLPVVSTPMRELDRFADAVYQAGTPEEFIRQVTRALADREPRRRQERIALAARETWDLRVITLLQAIETALNAPGRRPA